MLLAGGIRCRFQCWTTKSLETVPFREEFFANLLSGGRIGRAFKIDILSLQPTSRPLFHKKSQFFTAQDAIVDALFDRE